MVSWADGSSWTKVIAALRSEGMMADAARSATQRPLAVASIGVPVRRPAWKDRPSWFLVAEEDRMIPAETQRFMAKRMKARVRTAPADHMPMITAPRGHRHRAGSGA